MQNYDPKLIEKKWQHYWEKKGLFKTPKDATRKNKMYILPQLPYPSGSGLHVGHAEVYTACDIYARFQRMNGKKVLQVMGWDSFGLPAENYAIKTNVHPRISTDKAIDNFRAQIKSLGISVDWDREVGSHNPDYYKWTQWFFLLMYKRGLAYRKNQLVNWCDGCKTALANEQVTPEGTCERCDTVVVQKPMEQWYLKITEYADKLLEGLDRIDWPEETKMRQRNWIGRSEGANWKLKVKDSDITFRAYDSVPQTYKAQTFVVVAPEHPAIQELVKGTKQEKAVLDFVETVKRKKMEGNKFEVEQEIEGIFTGRYIDNPFGTGDLPLWVASFVILEYGSGVVCSSAHDERDFAFAKKYNIPLRPVMFPADPVEAEKIKNLEYCYHHDPEAVLTAPEKFQGRKWGEAREDIIDSVVELGIADRAVQYKLRDWSVSRQRFWGAPIPMIYNEQRAKNKKHYIVIHGYTADSNSNFRPWLKQQLEKRGHTVWCGDLPNTNKPNINEQVDFIIKNTQITEDTVLVAHSHGGGVAFRLLEKTGKRVAKVVLVDCFYKPEFIDKKRPLVEKSDAWKFDFKKIRTRADEFVVLHDADEKTISRAQAEEMANLLGARLVFEKPREEHFTADEESSVLEESIVTGFLPIPEKDLPVILPDDVDFKPTGQSPLHYSKSFNDGVEKKYGKGPDSAKATPGKWRREPDTLDTFMCSSWYYYRYLDPKNDKEFASPESLKTWMPVDFYLGGEEHVNGHLLYARFFTKVLFDAGYINFDEPFLKHRHQGLILGEDSRKMSKRWDNVINPTDVVNEYGADTCRMYEMFMGPLEATKPWSTNGVKGIRRFLERVWRLQENVQNVVHVENVEIERLVHKTIKKVGEDLESLRFNTAIAKMMELVNEFYKAQSVSKEHFELFILMLSPLAPHMAEELWSGFAKATPDKSASQYKDSVALQPWPKYDSKKIVDDMITLPVQVNGKVRANIEVSADIGEDEARERALAEEKVQKWLEGKEPKKVIYVKGKLVSIVV